MPALTIADRHRCSRAPSLAVGALHMSDLDVLAGHGFPGGGSIAIRKVVA
jgi:hypothetical protein